jgi:hypothetical protein
MARMINKAGATVLPNVDSIQLALEDFQEALQDGTGLFTHHNVYAANPRTAVNSRFARAQVVC